MALAVDWTDLLTAFALYLILEGILPFANPGVWRRTLQSMGQLNDGQLRSFGAIIVGAGLVMLFVVRGVSG